MKKIDILKGVKNTEVLNKVTRSIGKASLQLKKHSPEILVVVGVIGAVTSTVVACKATTKLSSILEETKDNVDAIHEASSNPEFADKYTEEDSKKDLAIVYAQSGLKLAKLYAPAFIVGTVSIACILTSHKIMKSRNIALAAAYMAESKSFKEYRSRVIERFGEALDRELKYNVVAKEVEETVVHEDGTEQVVKKTVHVSEGELCSPYAKFFDEYCTGWDKDPDYNLMFLRQMQNVANDKLQARGYLFLNEVYDMLGLPHTKAGQIVGWVYNSERGDGYVDFGIYDLHNEQKRDFVNGRERSILLDFNVDGEILDLF